MSAPTVLELPSGYDRIALSGLGLSPGIIDTTDGGERKVKIEDQGQLLSLGANTVIRQLPNRIVTWHFVLWEAEHFATKARWEAALEAGAGTTNPTKYDVVDLAIPTLKRVVFESYTPQRKRVAGRVPWALTMHEWTRIRPYGGPVKPADNAVTRAIADASKQAAALEAQLASLKKGKP